MKPATRYPQRYPNANEQERPQGGEEPNSLILQGYDGERGGTRTHDPLIKSQMLYRLSYALPGGSPLELAAWRKRVKVTGCGGGANRGFGI